MNLHSYDVIVVNSSGGKDSQAMLDYVVEQAPLAALEKRIVVAHADLGRVEWPGARELVQEHAAHYGLPCRIEKRPQGDLLDHIEARGRWPSSQARYCTSDHKRGQVARIFTALAREAGRPIRILNCLGMRRLESPARAKLKPFEHDARHSSGQRHVDRWHPILAWTLDEVWARNRAAGTRHHFAYDLGMPRLSCCFCVFAPRSALLLAGKHNPALLAEYVRVEHKINHSFRKDFRIAEIQAALAAGEVPHKIQDWNM